MASGLSAWFNELASEVGAAEIIGRATEQSSIGNRSKDSTWVILPHVWKCLVFSASTERVCHAAMAQGFLLSNRKCPEAHELC